ncbi:MAG: hypothetical protein K2O33_02085, partial [Muribaculaceae bacterium]|nr:hypothetical protein [Muribaculaceae bacterium]
MNFEFEKRAGAAPYTVPDGFFERMEERIVMRAVALPAAKPRLLSSRLCYAAAAAVAALVVGTAALFQPGRQVSDGYDEIAQLFQQLPQDDQNEMLESYQDDIF